MSRPICSTSATLVESLTLFRTITAINAARLLIFGDLDHQFEDDAPERRCHRRKGFQQFWRPSLSQMSGVLSEQWARDSPIIQVANQIDHPTIQRVGDIDKSGEADSIETPFVFLNLLERQPHRIGQNGLRHA